MPLLKSNDSESKKFWKEVKDVVEEIKRWPEWKRDIRLTKYSTDPELSKIKKKDKMESRA